MASKKIAEKDIKVDKEKMSLTIKNKLKASLQGLQEQLGEKKFEKRISKATELLVRGIKIPPVKKKAVVNKKIAKAKS